MSPLWFLIPASLPLVSLNGFPRPALEIRGWPRSPDRGSRQFVVDRNSSNEPVAQPVPIADLETQNLLDFFVYYDVVTLVNSGDWKGILCTCFTHVTYGCCGHSISIYRRLGGILTAESRACEPSIGFRPKKGKVRTRAVPAAVPAIAEFIPHAATNNSREWNVEASDRVENPVHQQRAESSPIRAQSDALPAVVNQPIGETETVTHDSRQAPEVVIQTDMNSNGSTGRPKRTQSSSVYRR